MFRSDDPFFHEIFLWALDLSMCQEQRIPTSTLLDILCLGY